MSEVRYTITKDQKPTEEQIREIEDAKKRQDALLEAGRKDEVYDDDCPEIDPVTTPEMYESLMRAVGERNKRVASICRRRA